MSDIAIRVENLSKLYHIGAAQPRHDTLRDALAGVLPRISRMKKTEEIYGNPSNPWQKEDTDCHAVYGDYAGAFGLENGKLPAGQMPPQQMKKIRNFIESNRDELMEQWNELTG